MNPASPDPMQIARISKMSSILKLFVWPGAAGVLVSFFEQSPLWTFFIVLTGWIGVVMGLSGGPGVIDHLLKMAPSHRQVSNRMWTMVSVGTFWIPALATGIFGIGLASSLGENHQPQSHLNDNLGNYLLLNLQVFSLYFLATGVCWMVVGRELRRTQQGVDSPGNQASQK